MQSDELELSLLPRSSIETRSGRSYHGFVQGCLLPFASKSGGYWHSDNLINWDLITSEDLPLEDYAPTAVVMNDTLYFMASSSKPIIYKTPDPQSGKWETANPNFPIGMTDPDLFVDNNGRLYFYYGCSDINPIYGVELDTKTSIRRKTR